MKQWWIEYDTDGYFHIVFSEQYTPYASQLGPFKTFSEAKKNLIWCLTDCKNDICGSIKSVRKLTKKEVINFSNE